MAPVGCPLLIALPVFYGLSIVDIAVPCGCTKLLTYKDYCYKLHSDSLEELFLSL